MKQLFVIDVSGYVFRAYHALPPMTNSEGLGTQALFGFIRAMLKLIKDFAPEHMVAVFEIIRETGWRFTKIIKQLVTALRKIYRSRWSGQRIFAS
jgi:5'-3' exonuclease